MQKPVAYLIIAHTDPYQCHRLVRRLLLDSSTHVFIHLDLKSKDDFSRVFCLDTIRIHAAKTRYEVSWSGFSTVLAILACMREALAVPIEFGYFVLLSGLDYPLKHPDGIKEYLYGQAFRQHINRINIADSPEHYLKLARRFTFRDAWLPAGTIDKAVRKFATIAMTPIKRKLLPVTICTGSSWWALTRECAQFIVDFSAQQPEYNAYFKWLHCPEEHYFHTIIENSHFAAEAPPMLTYTGRGMWKTANLHVIHPSLRKIYTDADLPEIAESGKCFVRKVTTLHSSLLLDKIDSAIESADQGLRSKSKS
jgi:core-2/I-Branching enzyme